VHSLYRSSTRGPEDDSVESKHVAPLQHYMFILRLLCLTEPHPPLDHNVCWQVTYVNSTGE